MTLVDSHCHLDDEQFDADREQVIDRAAEAGVARMVVIGTGDGPPDLEPGIRLAERFPAVSATAGVHPHHASKADRDTLPRLRELLRHPKVIALGEIGLDYHYDFSPRDVQMRVFLEQLELARDAGKPVVIHTREAWQDTFETLERHWKGSNQPCIFHCFTGGPSEIRRALELGAWISFGGVVTFPKAVTVQEAARLVPRDRLLIETDAPYLAPVPHRGKRNEPAFAVHTLRKLAELRGEDAGELAAATTTNFARLTAG